MDLVEAELYAASVTVPNRIESVRPAAAFLVQTARALDIEAARRPLFEVAVTEALTNAVKHGHGPSPHSEIVCELELASSHLTIRVLDEGPGFSIASPAPPQVGVTGIDRLGESGYGLLIIHSVFPVVRAHRVRGRFALELTLPLI